MEEQVIHLVCICDCLMIYLSNYELSLPSEFLFKLLISTVSNILGTTEATFNFYFFMDTTSQVFNEIYYGWVSARNKRHFN